MLKALDVTVDDDVDENALREQARQALVRKRQTYTSDVDALRCGVSPVSHLLTATCGRSHNSLGLVNAWACLVLVNVVVCVSGMRLLLTAL